MPFYPKCSYVKENRFKKQIKRIISFVIYFAVLLFRPKPPTKQVASNSVAIIFLASLGDLVVLCGAVKEMKACGKSITLICKQGTAAEFAALTQLFDEIIEININGFERFRNIRKLAKIEVDTVFCAPLGRHILPDIYACAVKANKRLFPDTFLDCSLPSLKSKIDKRADKLIALTEINELKRYSDFLFACDLIKKEIRPFRFEQNVVANNSSIAIFPGAGGGKGKRWNVIKFAYVAKQLVLKGLVDKVLIFGEKYDAECCNELFQELNSCCRVENLCEKTTISELIEIVSNCCIALANDSGSAHISMACDTPTLIVCGMWQYGRFYPEPKLEKYHYIFLANDTFGQSCNSSVPLCRQQPAPCVQEIKADIVLAQAERILTNQTR